MRKLSAFIVGLLVVLLVGYAESANAADFTVTKSTNSNDGACDSDCSLREAVAVADSGDTVVFAGYLIGDTFTLGGEEIVITKRITIDGALQFPAVVHISGENTSRIFLIETGGGLELRNAVLVSGNGVSVNYQSGFGGAINAKAGSILSLDRVAVRNNTSNSAGAFYAGQANVHIVNTSFTSNSATACVAFTLDESIANIANVTISNNFDNDLNDGPDAGAVCLRISNTTIRNSTIANNNSYRGGIFLQKFPNQTSILNIGNTIVAQNDVVFGGDIDDNFGGSTIISAGGNLIGTTFQVPAGTFTQPNDATGINPLLAPINTNLDGFPVVSHPLQAGSPAFNTGLNANAVDPLTNQPLTTDTRGAGFPRVAGGTVDKGAFEDQTDGFSLIVTKNANSNDFVCDTDCSLREAAYQASVHPGTDTITFAFSVIGTIALGGSEILIENQNVNIIGCQCDPVSGGNTNRIFHLNNATANISQLTLTNGNAGAGFGGAILSENGSNLTLDKTVVSNNFATAYGAVYLSGGTGHFINSTINNNSATTGLAIGVSGTLNMANTTVSGNLDSDGGTGIGAIYVTGTAHIRNSTIAFNRTSGGTGGGIFSAGTLNIGNSIVANNIAAISPDIELSSGVITSVGGNLVLDTNGFAAGTFNQANDHTGVDPQLGVLADNGGNVPTHEIQPFSLAVNQGVNANAVDPFDNSPLSNDARGQGFPRLQSTSVDKGAFESAAPTAAGATVSGRIVDEHGAPVAGAVVNLSGTQNRKIITNANGDYRFLDVETNGFYTITPSRVNYNFNPVNRSFSQLGNKTEAAFNATATGDEANPIDTPEYFVRQQYVDILSREPDEAGFNYWSDQILVCGGDLSCVRGQRIGVAAAFFIEQEAQQSGSFIYDMYVGALGRGPMFNEYAPDRQQVVGGPNLDAQKKAFAQAFVQRGEFVARYQADTAAESFVDALLQSVQSSGVDLSGERANLIGIYNGGADTSEARAQVVHNVADNAAFMQSQYNQAFVLTEYFGYLRRNADVGGFSFWLNVLNSGERNNYRGMVCSFITSAEYQRRFSPVVTRSNAECR